MRFGKQHLDTRLVIARVVVYCQAAALTLVAVQLLEILLIGGASGGLSFRGVFTSTPISGNGTIVSAFAFVVVALVLIVVEQRAAGGEGARQTLAAVEIIFAVCFVGFVATAAGGWVFGPAAALVVVGLNYWPELIAYFFADDAPATSSGGDGPASATLATMSTASVPPSAAVVPAEATAAPPFTPPASPFAPPASPGPPDPTPQ
jgi:hypothetical protein